MHQLGLDALLLRYGVAPPAIVHRPEPPPVAVLRTTVWRANGTGVEVEQGPDGELTSAEPLAPEEAWVARAHFALVRERLAST